MSDRTEREIDLLVASKIMGWPETDGLDSLARLKEQASGYVCDEIPYVFPSVGFCGATPWRPTTDAGDDYSVLCHVRETWDGGSRGIFVAFLRQRFEASMRDGENLLEQYRVGDFARAALAVVSSSS